MRAIRLFLAISLCLILAACSKNGAQLDEFKRLEMCQGKTLQEFIEKESLSYDWFTTKEGTVGFVAEFENYDGKSPFKYGVTARAPVESQSTVSNSLSNKKTLWDFELLRLDISKNGEENSMYLATVNLELESFCLSYKKLTQEELAQRRVKEAEERAAKLELLSQAIQEDEKAIESLKNEIASFEPEIEKLTKQLETTTDIADQLTIDSQIRWIRYDIEGKQMQLEGLNEQLMSKQKEADTMK